MPVHTQTSTRKDLTKDAQNKSAKKPKLAREAFLRLAFGSERAGKSSNRVPPERAKAVLWACSSARKVGADLAWTFYFALHLPRTGNTPSSECVRVSGDERAH